MNNEKVNKVEKVDAIISEIRTCMFCTIDDEGKMNARPMQTAKYDEHGNIWFFTDKNTAKVTDLENQNSIMLTYAKPSSNTYLSIAGKAVLNDDMDNKKALFNNFTKAWFPNGPESEDLILLKFMPDAAEFWDSSDSKLVQLFKIGKAVVKGEKYETNEEDHGNISM